MSILTQLKSNNITTYCNAQQNFNNIAYLKAKSSGNDPTISKAMRYAEYVRSHKSTPIINYKFIKPIPTQTDLQFIQVNPRPYSYGFTNAINPAFQPSQYSPLYIPPGFTNVRNIGKGGI